VGAAILMAPEEYMNLETELELLAGSLSLETKGKIPFDASVCSFLSDLSNLLMRDKVAKTLNDVTAFAFWCRKANIHQLKDLHLGPHIRIGRGMAFHISPGNVPINAFYSFAFGLLAGNGNIVRLPSKVGTSIDVVIKAINLLFEQKQYSHLAHENAFVRYDHKGIATDQLSLKCDTRIIWGGDSTIATIRKSPIAARTQEITFADRYSFAVLDADTIEKLSDSELNQQAINFYNDTLQMDQNACSSPHLMVWLNGNNNSAKERFWKALDTYTLKRYQLEAVQSVDRYTRLLAGFITGPEQHHISDISAPLQRVKLKTLPKNIDSLRGIYGLFYEYDSITLSEVAHIVNSKYQTVSYLGIDKSTLADFVINNRLKGIDRIVPVGEALNMNILWDGYNILNELSRIIDVR